MSLGQIVSNFSIHYVSIHGDIKMSKVGNNQSQFNAFGQNLQKQVKKHIDRVHGKQRNPMNNWRHPVFSLGEDFPMFELKYDWSRRFQFDFEWIELTIVDNKLGRNGQLAGDWEGKVGGRIRSRNTAASFSNQIKSREETFVKKCTLESRLSHRKLSE